jgi:hypothetical protein
MAGTTKRVEQDWTERNCGTPHQVCDSSQSKSNIIFLHHRYVQPGDVGYHADFQREFDRDMLVAKKAAFAKKPNHKLTANEWRELMVEVGGHVWYELISEETIAKSHLSAGWSSALDGSQNNLARTQLPSGKQLFPSYGTAGQHSSAAQSGFGVVVNGVGCERVGEAPWVGCVPSQATYAQLVVQEKEGDSKLVFRTEKEQQLENAKPTTERKLSTNVSLEQETSDTGEGDSETSDEELHPFDKEHFVATANEAFGKDFSLELTAPTALDSSLVHQYIAFHFEDGWDCGQIVRDVDSSKHIEGFNYDVRYPSRGGTVFHRLQLNLYGVGDQETSPLGSWVMLSCAVPLQPEPAKKKRRR